MNKTILFQGDSITDADRFLHNDLGRGYVNLVAQRLPDDIILNRGISGNETSDLIQRWQTDTIQLKPDILSVFIGINDVWHRHADHTGTAAADFNRLYREMLLEVKKALPNTKILMIEPFCLTVDDFQKSWRHELDEIIQLTREIARDHADAYIALDGILAEASHGIDKREVASDGVHPTDMGHRLIAERVVAKIRPFL